MNKNYKIKQDPPKGSFMIPLIAVTLSFVLGAVVGVGAYRGVDASLGLEVSKANGAILPSVTLVKKAEAREICPVCETPPAEIIPIIEECECPTCGGTFPPPETEDHNQALLRACSESLEQANILVALANSHGAGLEVIEIDPEPTDSGEGTPAVP